MKESNFIKNTPEKPSEEHPLVERLSRTTGRPLEFYNRFLGMKSEDYRDKTILNIGAGTSDIVDDLERDGIKPNLIANLDLAYKDVGSGRGVFRWIAGKSLDRDDVPRSGVAGDMKRLPFGDDSVDKVLFLWSLGWIEKDDRKRALLEAWRATKEGGDLRIYPVAVPPSAAEIVGSYYFIKLKVAGTVPLDIIKAGTKDKNLLATMSQYLANVDALTIEQTNRLVEFLKGKRVATLSFTKTANISGEQVSAALDDLSGHRFEFQ